jgi:hypothetical protein
MCGLVCPSRTSEREGNGCVCVFITAGPSTELFAWGWRGKRVLTSEGNRSANLEIRNIRVAGQTD